MMSQTCANAAAEVQPQTAGFLGAREVGGVGQGGGGVIYGSAINSGIALVKNAAQILWGNANAGVGQAEGEGRL